MAEDTKDLLTRRKNLNRIAGNKHGGQAALAKEIGISESYLNQLLSGHRNIGGSTARKIETALKMERYELDRAQGDMESPASIEEIEDVLQRTKWLSPENRTQIIGLISSLKK